MIEDFNTQLKLQHLGHFQDWPTICNQLAVFDYVRCEYGEKSDC
jgi:hypothetical protein